MIKVVTLASLCALMIGQAHAGLAVPPPLVIAPNECLFARQTPAPGPPLVGGTRTIVSADVLDLGTRLHLQANADNVSCVQRMEKGFLSRLDAVSAVRVLRDLFNASTIQHVKEDVLKGLPPLTCARFLRRVYVRRMTTKQIAALPNDCFSDANIGLMSPAQIKAIDLKKTGKSATDFLAFGNFLPYITEKQLSAAAGNDYALCSRIALAGLAAMDRATLANLDYRCLKAIDLRLITADEAKMLTRKLKPEALGEIGVNGIPIELLKLLGPRFLKALDKKSKDDQCKLVDLRNVKVPYAGDVDKTCFLHAITGMDKAHVEQINTSFYLLAAKNLFADFKETDLIEKIAATPGIWHALQKEHYADIIKLSSDNCEYISFLDTSKRFTYAADLEADCFARMTEATQKWVLEHHGMVVKEDILSKVDGSRREANAYLEDVIKHLATARPQLLKHFGVGEASSSENVCSTYDVLKLKDPKELKRAGRYFPVNCLKSMRDAAPEDAIQFTDLSLYPKALVDLLDMTVLIANLSDSSLSSMDEAKWKEFMGPATCGALTHEKFGHISPDIAFTHLSATCLDAFTFLDKLDKADVQRIPPKVLGSAKPETIGKFNSSDFTVEQVKALGANAAGLDSSVFEKFDNDQVGALTAAAISSLPVGVFSALKADGKWQQVNPEALVSIKYDQLSAVPEEVLLQTTEQQARKIPADAARAFTAERRDKLPHQVSAALPPLPAAAKDAAPAK